MIIAEVKTALLGTEYSLIFNFPLLNSTQNKSNI